jgi:Flp pilus assembly protein TadG
VSVERGLRRLPGDRSGAAAIEFALVFPVLVTLLIGLLQLGWALHCASSVRWALETSARTLLLNPGATAGDLKTAMVAKLSNVADSSNLSVTLTTQTAAGGAKVLHAASTYAYVLQVPLLPGWTLTFNAATDVPSP